MLLLYFLKACSIKKLSDRSSIIPNEWLSNKHQINSLIKLNLNLKKMFSVHFHIDNTCRVHVHVLTETLRGLDCRSKEFVIYFVGKECGKEWDALWIKGESYWLCIIVYSFLEL